MPGMPGDVPTIDDIRSAAERLTGYAVMTPLLHGSAIDGMLGVRAFFKPECLQRTGSFKFRGAYNALSRLDYSARKRGVVACSSGNHAQGVAEAARLLGIPATIVMPSDAPTIKLDRTSRSGAKIVTYDRAEGDREAIADAICAETGATLIHPYDNVDVIAGQGTCGLEMAAQLAGIEVVPDRILVCTGGGGLTAGIAIAMQAQFPDAVIHTVEPEGFDDTRRSIADGRIRVNRRSTGSACDALLSPSPGEISFAINSRHVRSGLVVTDKQAFAAMRLAFEELKLVLEPGGAVAIAALAKEAAGWQDESVAVVLSGGNVDPALYARVLSGQL